MKGFTAVLILIAGLLSAGCAATVRAPEGCDGHTPPTAVIEVRK